MEPQFVGLVGVAALLIFLAIGMPLAFAAALAGFLGSWYLSGITPALAISGLVPFAWTSRYSLTVLPLFIFMGYFAFAAGLATRAFDTGRKWLGHIPGGEALATVTGCAAFAACSGSSSASTAIFSKVAIPEMEKRGYSQRLSAGVVAASGTFASMIPPSATLVVYAVLVETSVGKQLMAGIFPGLLTAVVYALVLSVWVKLQPSVAPMRVPPAPWTERLSSLGKIWGIFLLAVIIVGGIYSGFFTPTESGAAGAFAAMLLFLASSTGQTKSKFMNALLETGRTTSMIFLLIVGVMIFARFLALSRLTYDLADWIGGLNANRYVIFLAIMLFYLILGMFFEAAGMLMLTIPVVIPIMEKLGFDLIWFGVFLVKLIEIAVVTPPVGLTVYVVKGVCPHIPLGEIFRGIFPFVLADIIVLILLLIWPQIALFLPNTM